MFDDIDGYYEGYDEALNAEEVERLMDYEDNEDAIHAAAEAYAEAHADDPTCSYCYGYGHSQDGCEVFADDKQIIAQDQARRAAKFFGADDDDMFVMGDPPEEEDDDDPWKDEFIALGQGWFENSYGDSFTTDPHAPSYDANGIELKCTCDAREDEDECFICSVGRMSPAHMWRPYRDDHDYEVYNEMGRKNRPRRQKKKQKATQATLPLGNTSTATPKTTTTTTTTTTTAYVGKDSHFADPYTTYDGKLTFYLTSGRAGGNNRKEGEFVPDWGLYFDWSWRPWWRAEHIDWKDFGLPEAWDIAFEQLTVAIEKATAGNKVEMGCIGAHGRTGTALAAINVILGCSAKEAIKHVRKHHCHHAIESASQEWWVEWVESQVTGKPCRPKPTTPAPKAYNSTAPGYNSAKACTQQGHFDAWLWLPADKDGGFCPNKGASCDWWDKDIANFYDGKFITWGADDYKKTPMAGNTTVNGYVVPSPTYGKGAVNHNATKYNANDCWCDVCRYLEKGYGALLRPSDAKLGKEHDDAMWDLESSAKLAIAHRKLALIASMDLTGLKAPVTEPAAETIKVATADGEIIEVSVADDFTPQPPPDVPNIKHGTKKGEYTYLDGRGWVWNGQLAAIK
jgi:hypothetical protein